MQLTGSVCFNWWHWAVLLLQIVFSLFHLHHPLQVPLFDNRWLHLLTCFGPYYLHVSNLFYLFKLMALTSLLLQTSFFHFFAFLAPPAAPTTGSGQRNLWTLFRYNFLYVNFLFYWFKLILMTCITVVDCFFAFSPITPCRSNCSTTGEVIH